MTRKRKRNKQQTEKDTRNPLLEAQSNFLQTLTDDERDNFFSSTLPAERRAELWMEQADLGETLVNRYAWATPDNRALNILKQFSPIVEIGCGSNAYWCRCMADAGLDVVGYDVALRDGGKIKRDKTSQTGKDDGPSKVTVRKGGPEVLSSKKIRDSNRTLFLCYPDEDDQEPEESDNNEFPQSLGAACLEHYGGQYVIHVGELFGDTPSLDQAPWGRSSSSEFQQRLMAEYHCLLKAGLTNWLHVRDTISVWKRSETCSIVFAAEDEDDQDEQVEYKHVPVDERLPIDVAAPCMKHLLTNNETGRGQGLSSQVSSPAPCESLSSENGGKEKKTKKKRRKNKASRASTSESTETAAKEFVSPW